MATDDIPEMPGITPSWVGDAIRSYCQWHIAPSVTQTVVLGGDGSSVAILPSLYVTDVSEVILNGTVLDPGSYSWTTSGILYLKNYRTYPGAYGVKSLQVTMTHGYETVPAALSQVATRIAQAPAYSSMVVDGVSLSGGASVFNTEGTTAHLLAPYVREVMP